MRVIDVNTVRACSFSVIPIFYHFN